MKAIRINEVGGPEVLQLEDVETPTPRQGEVLIKVAAAGINFADLAQRQGHYLTPTEVPTILGFEWAACSPYGQRSYEQEHCGDRLLAGALAAPA